MERETLLAMLIMLLGGIAVQAVGSRLSAHTHAGSASELERRIWWRLCLPVVPLLLVAAWLCGWALTEPDPVPDRLDPGVLVAICAPFAWLFARALARAIWALLRDPGEWGVCTVGLLRPQVLFSPYLARQLEEPVLRAALAHEGAHVRHRDPLRIWLAQLITDLQWPWPKAARRLEAWLTVLEHARDDEARAAGVDGADLAAAVVASVRFRHRLEARDSVCPSGTQLPQAPLIGDSRALRERVSRLFAPLETPARAARRCSTFDRAALLLIPLLLIALILGVAYGESVIRPLLGMTS